MCPPTLIVPAWRRETKMSKARLSVGEVFERLLGPTAAVSITAYDGSSSGPADAPVAIRVCSPLALDYLMSSPGDLGLARAYVSGALDVSGDLYTALRTLSDQVDQLSPADRLWLLRTLGPRHLRRVRPPAEELPGRFRRGFSGLRHSRARDSDAISTVGLTEHVGARNLPSYFRFLANRLKPRRPLLNHCMTNPDTSVARRSRGFIDRYVFPDGELEAPGEIVTAMHDSGLEVRH